MSFSPIERKSPLHFQPMNIRPSLAKPNPEFALFQRAVSQQDYIGACRLWSQVSLLKSVEWSQHENEVKAMVCYFMQKNACDSVCEIVKKAPVAIVYELLKAAMEALSGKNNFALLVSFLDKLPALLRQYAFGHLNLNRDSFLALFRQVPFQIWQARRFLSEAHCNEVLATLLDGNYVSVWQAIFLKALKTEKSFVINDIIETLDSGRREAFEKILRPLPQELFLRKVDHTTVFHIIASAASDMAFFLLDHLDYKNLSPFFSLRVAEKIFIFRRDDFIKRMQERCGEACTEFLKKKQITQNDLAPFLDWLPPEQVWAKMVEALQKNGDDQMKKVVSLYISFSDGLLEFSRLERIRLAFFTCQDGLAVIERIHEDVRAMKKEGLKKQAELQKQLQTAYEGREHCEQDLKGSFAYLQERSQTLASLQQKMETDDIVSQKAIIERTLKETEKYIQGLEASLKLQASMLQPLEKQAYDAEHALKVAIDAFEKCKDTKGEKYLDEFHGKPLTYDNLKCLFVLPLSNGIVEKLQNLMQNSNDKTLQNIAARFDFMKKEWAGPEKLEKKMPPLFVILNTARYVEREIFAVNQVAEGVWKRKKTGLKRGLQVWKENGQPRVAVFSKSELSSLHAQGTYKMIDSSLSLFPELGNRMHTVRAYTRGFVTIEEVQEAEAEFQIMKELDALQKKAGVRVFVPFYAMDSYTYQSPRHQGEDNCRVSAILKRAAFNGAALQKKKEFQAGAVQFLPVRMHALEQLLKAGAILHSNNYIQGDLKLLNLVCAIEENGKLQLLMTDFGFTRKLTDGKARQDFIDTVGDFNMGYYGTHFLTAPELFLVTKFTKDLFKVESFAFGYVLFQLFFNGNPFWHIIIDQRISRETLYKAIEPFIEPTAISLLAKYDKGGKFTDPEAYLLIMSQLLRPDPDKRWSMMAALNAYQKLHQEGRVESFQDKPASFAKLQTIMAEQVKNVTKKTKEASSAIEHAANKLAFHEEDYEQAVKEASQALSQAAALFALPEQVVHHT